MLEERPSYGVSCTMLTALSFPFLTVARTWIWPYGRPFSEICSSVPVAERLEAVLVLVFVEVLDVLAAAVLAEVALVLDGALAVLAATLRAASVGAERGS